MWCGWKTCKNLTKSDWVVLDPWAVMIIIKICGMLLLMRQRFVGGDLDRIRFDAPLVSEIEMFTRQVTTNKGRMQYEMEYLLCCCLCMRSPREGE